MITSVAGQTGQIPVIFEPEHGNDLAALLAWTAGHRAQIEEHLNRQGALLFRGYQIHSPDDFQKFAGSIAPKFVDYTRGASPRKKVQGQVYTSTEAPRQVPIALHNELAYVDNYPDRIFFFCDTPPGGGGETPIADMRQVYLTLDPNVRRRFEERGLRLIQNIPEKRSWRSYKTWPEMFETEDRDQVERACAAQNISCRFKPDGSLQLINKRPATIEHPVTGDRIWFNSAHNFHDSWSWEFRHAGRRLLAAGARLAEFRRRRRMRPEDYPNHCTFADGGEIPTADIEHIRATLWKNAILFPWQRGDVLVLDNLRVAHGRMPFKPPRRILVAMGNSAPAPATA